jgi:hypothetical protein
MTHNKFETNFDHIPTCSLEQHEAARAYVERNAPDLLAVIFGEGQQ